MTDTKYDSSKFVHPKFIFSERNIDAGQTVIIDQNDLKVSRDTIIDLISVSEETLSRQIGGIPTSKTYLNEFAFNWSIVERANLFPVGLSSLVAFHNFYEGDRSYPLVAAAQDDTWGLLRFRHFEPWVYNPEDSISVDWTVPVANILTPTVTLDLILDGVGLVTGLRRSFQIQGIVYPQSGATVISGTASNPTTMANLGDEPFKIVQMGIVFDSRQWLSNVNGTQLQNCLRMRIVPSIGDAWSDVPLPLIFYGVHMAPPCRSVIYKPAGGPLLLKAGQTMTFQFTNNSQVNGNIQVCLTGRVAPGIGSII